MKTKSTSGGLHVRAIAGTHVVLLAFDSDESELADVLGFGVERIDHTAGTRYWLTNNLRFPGAGHRWGTNFNPLQTFCWGDYQCEPGHSYTYVVHTMTGTPGEELMARRTASVRVRTEQPAVHGVWFNRGVISSQAYARTFDNESPHRVPRRAAWRWLSRGLEEALIGFIGQATDPSWELHGSFYEFEYPTILRALNVAASVGVGLHLIVDGEAPDTREAVTAAHLDEHVTTWRMKAQIPHNKFLVVSHEGVPVQVWTGSTNITENGIFGQSNVGHVVRDHDIAAAYLAYWHRLTEDPTPGVLNDWVEANNELPDAWPPGTTVVFSPRQGFAALDRYAAAFRDAGHLACATFAFNLDDRLGSQLTQPTGALRLLLFEDENKALAAKATITDPLTTIVWGSHVPEGTLASWVPELKNPLSDNIEYIHTKYLLIDPIYFTEFFRLFAHYRFRSALGLQPDEPSPGPMSGVEAAVHLQDQPWWRKYYSDPGRAAQRKALAGTTSG